MKKDVSGQLRVNELIQWQDQPGKIVTSRVLWLDRREDSVFLIDISKGDGFPEMRKLTHLVQDLAAGLVLRLTEDPYSKPADERSLTRKAREIRDAAWDIIARLVSVDHEPAIYFRNIRGSLVKEAAREHGVTVKTVYKYLRKYWQRGKNMNALLPDYDKSGGRGKLKSAGDKKRGRPRKHLGGGSAGINIDLSTRKVMAAVIAQSPGNPEQNSVRAVYDRLLAGYYADQVTFAGNESRPVPLPGAKIPTFVQFKYWHKLITENLESSQNLPSVHKPKAPKPRRQGLKLPDPEAEIAAAAEPGCSALDAYVMQGFEAKVQGRLDLTADCFKAALKLNPPLDLQVMLVLDLAVVLKEMGQYREALGILARFEKDHSAELLPGVIKEVRSNLKYLEILQEILVRTNTPALPFSKIPTIIKVGVQRKLDECSINSRKKAPLKMY